MADIRVDTLATLDKVQRAFALAADSNDEDLYDAARTIMSALVLVLRHRTAMIPEEAKPALDMIRTCR